MKKHLISIISAATFLMAALTFQACVNCKRCPDCCVGKATQLENQEILFSARQHVIIDPEIILQN